MLKRLTTPPTLTTALLCALCCLTLAASAHGEGDPSPTAGLTISGFIDTYHAWDLDQPTDNQRPGLFFTYSRHNEVTINLASIHLAWTHAVARANVGLMAGTYAQDNYAHELASLRALYEANAGLRVVENLWLDAGLFPSHLGFDSLNAPTNPNLTRTLAADSSPYYLAGARLTWTPSDKWTLAAVIANGWQNLRETPRNRSKGGGTQLQYAPTPSLLLNWSTWVSDEQPAEAPAVRVFQDLYMSFTTDTWTAHAGVDIGFQEKPNADGFDTWWVVTAVARRWLTPWLGLGGRVERFSDPEGVVLGAMAATYTGGSLNIDLRPPQAPQAMLRFEGRTFYADRDRFLSGPDGSQWNTAFFTSLAVSFDARLTP
jgi:hypothetical protein